MTLAAPSTSGRPWLSKDVYRGGTGYKGSSGWLKISSMMLALMQLIISEWAVLPLKALAAGQPVAASRRAQP